MTSSPTSYDTDAGAARRRRIIVPPRHGRTRPPAEPRIEPPDQTARAADLIQMGLAIDPGARSQTLARLIAASLHGGPGTALERFAATGRLDTEAALDELNHVQVPIEEEPWVDALGRFILLASGELS